jgi:hypothetical protein
MPTGGIQSGTWTATLDSSLTVASIRPIDDERFRAGRAARGFEDCRLFHWRGHWWFSATVLRTTSPVSPLGEPFENNWTPLVRGDELL